MPLAESGRDTKMSKETYYVIQLKFFEDENVMYRDSYGYFCNCKHHAEQFYDLTSVYRKINGIIVDNVYYAGKLFPIECIVTEIE